MVTGCLERKLIGEILIERGFITRAHLEAALECQRRSSDGFVGEILVRQGVLTEIDIVTALVIQCNLPYIAISRHQVDEAVVRMIPAEMARSHLLIPLDRIGNILSVVMVSPINEVLRAKVEGLTGCKVALFISSRSEVEAALVRYYPDPA